MLYAICLAKSINCISDLVLIMMISFIINMIDRWSLMRQRLERTHFSPALALAGAWICQLFLLVINILTIFTASNFGGKNITCHLEGWSKLDKVLATPTPYIFLFYSIIKTVRGCPT